MKVVILVFIFCLTASAHAKTSLLAIERLQKKVGHALETAQVLSAKELFAKIQENKKTDLTKQFTIFGDLYWSQQSDFIGLLNTFKKESSNKAFDFMLEKISHRYQESQYPLLRFAYDLHKEHDLLAQIDEMLTKQLQNLLIQGARRDELVLKKEQNVTYRLALTELLDLVNCLLISTK